MVAVRAITVIVWRKGVRENEGEWEGEREGGREGEREGGRDSLGTNMIFRNRSVISHNEDL